MLCLASLFITYQTLNFICSCGQESLIFTRIDCLRGLQTYILSRNFKDKFGHFAKRNFLRYDRKIYIYLTSLTIQCIVCRSLYHGINKDLWLGTTELDIKEIQKYFLFHFRQQKLLFRFISIPDKIIREKRCFATCPFFYQHSILGV